MMDQVGSLRRYAGSIIRYGLGLLALAWLLSEIDVDRVLALLGEIGPSAVAVLTVVTGVGLIARVYMWHVLIAHYRQTGFLASAKTDLAVNFINQLLPSRLSGRAAAPLVLHNQTGLRYADAVAVSGVHTGLYAILYGLCSFLGILFLILGGQLALSLVGLLLLSTGLYLIAGLFVMIAGINMYLMNRFIELLDALVLRLPGATIGSRLSALVRKVPEFTEVSANSFRNLGSSWSALGGYMLGWVGSVLIGPGIRVWILLTALGTSAGLDPMLFPFYLVAAYSVTLLPLTPGGIGITEATASAVFIALGVPREIIVPVIFIDRILGVYLPALGGWYPSMQLDLSIRSTDQP